MSKVPERPDNVLFDVWLLSRATTALIDGALDSCGLDADEFAIYSVLASGEAMMPSELAGWMAAPATSVSSYLKRFENRGHIRRIPNPADGRSYRVQLTAEGRRAHRVAGNRFRPVLEAVTTQLGRDAPEVLRGLSQLREVVATVREES